MTEHSHPVTAVVDLSVIPELARLRPDDLGSLARRMTFPGEGGAPDEDPEDGSLVRFLLSGSASAEGASRRLTAPALIGAVEALAGEPAAWFRPGDDARWASISCDALRSVMVDVFEVWVSILEHCVGRLIAVESGPGDPLRPRRVRPRTDASNLVTRIRLLGDCGLLAGLRVLTLGRLAMALEEHVLSAGSTLWEAGTTATECFVALGGRFSIVPDRGPVEEIEAGPGTVLGLRRALIGFEHPGRVVAVSDARVLSLSREILIDELEDDPEAADALLSAVARRVVQCEEPSAGRGA